MTRRCSQDISANVSKIAFRQRVMDAHETEKYLLISMDEARASLFDRMGPCVVSAMGLDILRTPTCGLVRSNDEF